jgi:hypothetical protein
MKPFHFQGESAKDSSNGQDGHNPPVDQTAAPQPVPNRFGWVRHPKLRRMRRIWPFAVVGVGLSVLLKSSREWCCQLAEAAIDSSLAKFCIHLMFDLAEVMVGLLII